MNSRFLEVLFEHFSDYKQWLQELPLSQHSVRSYQSRVNHFLVYLATSDEDYDDVLTNSSLLTEAVNNYKTHLSEELEAQANSINNALTAIDHFCQFLDIALPKVERLASQPVHSLSLTRREQDLLSRALEKCESAKVRCVAWLIYSTGMRIGECAALNLNDVPRNSRNDSICIKGNRRVRKVVLNESARVALKSWLRLRARKYAGSTEQALILNPQGGRISTAGIDLMLRNLGETVGIELSAQRLRHTCFINMAQEGHDLKEIATVGGHKKLDTVRRYFGNIKLSRKKGNSDSN
jgi:site-specific recombinase XerD